MSAAYIRAKTIKVTVTQMTGIQGISSKNRSIISRRVSERTESYESIGTLYVIAYPETSFNPSILHSENAFCAKDQEDGR